MTIIYWVSGFIAVIIFTYLLIALLKPEVFS